MKTPKDPSAMQPSEINRELARLRKEGALINDAFIAAGRGSERPSDYEGKTDPLSIAARANSRRLGALRMEIQLRYGPGACYLTECPRGFGPRK